MAAPAWLCGFCAKIPILGALSQTTLKDHAEALKRLCLPLIISTAPIWGGTLVLFVKHTLSNPDNPLLDLWNCFKIIIQNGELFIYSASTLAPVMYIVTRERSDISSFPGKYTFIALVWVCSALATIIFTTERYIPQQLPDVMLNFSMAVYVLAVLVFYFALVYDNAFPPNAAQMMRDEESEYQRRLRAHRG